MKAAVLYKFGETPRYDDFPDPAPGDGETLVRVQAAALENIDRAMARGDHYAAGQMIPALPAVMGFDGIGTLDDGRRVGFGGIRPPYGALAPLTVIKDGFYAPIPDGVDAPTAAAAPGSTLTALLPLKFAAKLQPGESVLVNGATGFAGRLAVQVANLLGAGRVIGTGRNPESLASLPALGADAVIDLAQPDDAVLDAFSAVTAGGCDVILDFLWGRPTELLLRALTPKELSFARKRTRLIHAGVMAGETIALAGEMLRTSGLEITGAGNIPPEAIPEATEQAWRWLIDGTLRCEIETVPLSRIAEVWDRPAHGKRLVIVP